MGYEDFIFSVLELGQGLRHSFDTYFCEQQIENCPKADERTSTADSNHAEEGAMITSRHPYSTPRFATYSCLGMD